eukprot:SAG22_NODE_31_length_27697_cov_7.384376_17_plen_114_part_00
MSVWTTAAAAKAQRAASNEGYSGHRAFAQSFAASAQHCTLSNTLPRHAACKLLGGSPLVVSPAIRCVATSDGFQYSTGSPPIANAARKPGAWPLSFEVKTRYRSGPEENKSAV